MGDSSGADHTRRVRVLALGANLMAVCLGWPMLFGGTPTVWQWAGLVGAGALLVFGGLAVPVRASAPVPARAAPLLLMAVPLAVGASMLAQPERVHLQALGIFGTLVAGASMLAYGAAALVALGGGSPGLPTTTRETRRQPWDTPPEPAPALQRPLLAMGVLGALAISVVGPLWGGLRRYEQYWGDAAAEGATLTATVAATLGATVLAVFVGGAIRTRRSHEPAPSLARAASLLAAAALGFVVYLLSQP